MEISILELSKLTGISKQTLITYLNGWKFARIPRRKKPGSNNRKIFFFTLEKEDIQALRAFKKERMKIK